MRVTVSRVQSQFGLKNQRTLKMDGDRSRRREAINGLFIYLFT